MDIDDINKAELDGLSTEEITTKYYLAAIELYEDGDFDADKMDAFVEKLADRQYFEAAQGVKDALTVIGFIESLSD